MLLFRFVKPDCPGPVIRPGPGFFITIKQRITTMQSEFFTPVHTPAHTPGPWRVFDVFTDPEIVTDSPTAAATESLVQFKGQRNARANARLMAAAPDLLEHLRTLIEKADDLIAAIDGTTDQFEVEVSALSSATSAAEKAMQAAGGAA
jgi:hypothetical protein